MQSVDPEQYKRVFGWLPSEAPKFECVQGDIFAFDWSDADLLFVNSTCFTQEMMVQINEKAITCKKGTWFITLSKRLPFAEKCSSTDNEKTKPDLHWEFVLGIKLKMSWG